MKRSFYETCIKRLLDFSISLLVLLCFWWLYVLVAILVRINLGAPVLFCQERPGKDEKIFKLYKFRTMTDKKDEKGELLPDEARLTAFGRFLRASSLDEIPELFNILKGDMSLIGPRPLLVRYLPRYNAEQKKRHLVRPGLSGWAQVNGRNATTWQARFAQDVWYVEHISFLLDVKILFLTVQKAILRHDNIHSATSATMEEFMGNETDEN